MTPSKPKPTIRILRIIARLNVGGPAQHVLWLTQHFSAPKSLFSTTLVTGRVAPGEQSMDYFAQELHVQPLFLNSLSRRVHFLSDIFAFFSLFKICLQTKPHIIHTHTAKAGALGRLCALFYRFLAPFLGGPPKIRIYHTFHGHVFSGYFSPFKTRLILHIERMLAKTCHEILVLSPEQHHDITQIYRICPPRKARIIPLGIDLQRLDRPEETPPQKSVYSPEYIAWVGRVTAIKDPFLLLEIAKEAKRQQKNWFFWVIGGGDLEKEVRQKIQEEQLPVEMKGFQSNIGYWLKSAQAVILTSHNEGTPLSLIEALYLNKKIVASAVGGVPGLLEEGRGLLLFERDPNAFVQALEQQLHLHSLIETRSWVEKHYSLKRLQSDLEGLYFQNLAPSIKKRLK